MPIKKLTPKDGYFHIIAHKVSEAVGHAWAFGTALCMVALWLVIGPFFHFSDTWQLVINTGTSIATFLIVFLIQNTQNRDTKIINLKLDELIKSQKNADKSSIDLGELSDAQLKSLEEHYRKLVKKS